MRIGKLGEVRGVRGLGGGEGGHSRSMDGGFSAIDVTVEPGPALTHTSGAPNRRGFI